MKKGDQRRKNLSPPTHTHLCWMNTQTQDVISVGGVETLLVGRSAVNHT